MGNGGRNNAKILMGWDRLNEGDERGHSALDAVIIRDGKAAWCCFAGWSL